MPDDHPSGPQRLLRHAPRRTTPNGSALARAVQVLHKYNHASEEHIINIEHRRTEFSRELLESPTGAFIRRDRRTRLRQRAPTRPRRHGLRLDERVRRNRHAQELVTSPHPPSPRLTSEESIRAHPSYSPNHASGINPGRNAGDLSPGWLPCRRRSVRLSSVPEWAPAPGSFCHWPPATNHWPLFAVPPCSSLVSLATSHWPLLTMFGTHPTR